MLDETAVIVALLPEGAVRLRWAHSDELFERPRGWYALAPCAAWAGEDTDDWPRGDPPMPTPEVDLRSVNQRYLHQVSRCTGTIITRWHVQ